MSRLDLSILFVPKSSIIQNDWKTLEILSLSLQFNEVGEAENKSKSSVN